MRISTFTNLSATTLLLFSIGLAATVIWGLSQLNEPYQLSQQYYELSQAVSLKNKQLINQYLNSGDALDLAAAEEHLQDILNHRLTLLPNEVREQVEPAAAALLKDLQTNLRAAGKLSGNGQGLLLQNEREFTDGLERLSDYASKGFESRPALAFQYAQLSARLSQLQHDRALLRQRFFSTLEPKRKQAALEVSEEIDTLTTRLTTMPRLGVLEENSDEDSLLLGGTEPQTAADLGDEIGSDLNYLAHRYAAELERTEQMLAARDQGHKRVNGLISELEQRILDSRGFIAQQKASVESRVELLLAIFIALIFLITAGSYAVQRSIMGAIAALVGYLKQLQQGDFSQRFTATGRYTEINSLAASANQLQAYIHDFVTKIQGNTQDLNRSSHGIEKVADGVQQISRELHFCTSDASTSVSQLVNSFRDVARNASLASQAATMGKQAVQNNTLLMNDLSSTIGDLSSEVELGVQIMQQLQNDTRNIRDVLNVIEAVAEQTSLLALNAAIESARAGEMGRGFAVVADEVRQLAQRTSLSTQEIQQQINALVSTASKAVNSMESQHAQARQSVGHTHEVTASLHKVSSAIDTINDMNAMIAQATEEQVAAASGLSESVTYVTRVSEQAAADASTAQRQSKELSGVSQQLSGLIQHFQI